MNTLAFTVGGRTFNLNEIATFLSGSSNPYFNPLRGLEPQIAKWAVEELGGTAQQIEDLENELEAVYA